MDVFCVCCCLSSHNILTPVVSQFNCYPEAKESVLQDYSHGNEGARLYIPLKRIIDGPGAVEK